MRAFRFAGTTIAFAALTASAVPAYAQQQDAAAQAQALQSFCRHSSIAATKAAVLFPTRRAMLASLSQGEHTVMELARPFRMSLAAASKHVKTLERAGLVRRTVQGRTHFCRLDPGPLAEAQDWLRFYERFWNERLDTLAALFTPPDKER